MDQVNEVLESVKDYFSLYDFIEINLTETNKNGYTVYLISIRSTFEDVFVEVKYKLNHLNELIDENDQPVLLNEMWKLLYLESMKSYNLAMKRLMKIGN